MYAANRFGSRAISAAISLPTWRVTRVHITAQRDRVLLGRRRGALPV
jgi:hypothetical protein